MNKTKIVCTLGPASFSYEVIKEMYEAGLSGVRINTAYGSIDQYKRTVECVREIDEIPIILDVKGPEIRINAKRMVVSKGEVFDIGFGDKEPSFNWDFYDKMAVGDWVFH